LAVAMRWAELSVGIGVLLALATGIVVEGGE
jgi:hypothetical protein